MKIKNGFYLKTENGENIIVCDKKIYPNFNTTIVLTQSSVVLWKMLENGSSNKEHMLTALLEKFDISTVLALNDIDVFIRTLKENGILEE